MPHALAYAVDSCLTGGRAPWLEDSSAKRQLEWLEEPCLVKRPRLGPHDGVSSPKHLLTWLLEEPAIVDGRETPKGDLQHGFCTELLHDVVRGAIQLVEWTQEMPLTKRRRMKLVGEEDVACSDMSPLPSSFCWGDLSGLSVNMKDADVSGKEDFFRNGSYCDRPAEEDKSPVIAGAPSSCTDIVPYRVSEYLSTPRPFDLCPRLLKPLAATLRIAKIAMHDGAHGAALLPELALVPRGGCRPEETVIHLNGQQFAIELYDHARCQEEKDEVKPMDTA